MNQNKPQAAKYLTIIVALLSMIGAFSVDAYLPSFPGIEAEFSVGRTVLSQSLATYLAAFAIATLFWGPLADRIGRRPVIIGSMLLYFIGSLGCALADNIHTFLLLRLMQGLAASGGLVAGRAMLRDTYTAQEAHRAMSHVMLLFAIAPAIAPIIGAWLYEQFGWHSIFWFLAGYGMLLIIFMTFIGETLSLQRRQSFHPFIVFTVYLQMIRQRRFIALVFSLSFAFAGLFLYIAGSPTVIYDFLGLTSQDFKLQFVPMVGGMMVGSIISSKLSHHWPINRTITTGFGVMFVAIIINLINVNLFEANIATVIGPLVLYSLGLAIIMPAMSILALDCFPKNQGMAAAVQSFIQMIMTAFVASIVVPLLQTQWLHFVLGQWVFLIVAMSLWLGLGNKRVLKTD